MSQQQLEKLVGILHQQAPLGTQSIETSRQFMDEAGSKFAVPDDVTLQPFMIGPVEVEFIDAPDADQQKVLLYFHGGGYVSGSIHSHRYLMQNLSRASGTRTLGINYRLAPEHPFPAAIDDAVSCYRWLLAEGYKPGDIAIGGDSAGGGLVVATLLSLRDAGDPLPAASLCISPWADLTGTAKSYETQRELDPMISPVAIRKIAQMYLGNTKPENPGASPIFADLSGLPPLLIQVGEREVLHDDSLTLSNNIQQAGGEVTLEIAPNMIHVWHAFAPMLSEGQQAVDRAGHFIRSQLTD